MIRQVTYQNMGIETYIFKDPMFQDYAGCYITENKTLEFMVLENPHDNECSKARAIGIGPGQRYIQLIDSLVPKQVDSCSNELEKNIRAYLDKLKDHWMMNGYHEDLIKCLQPEDLLVRYRNFIKDLLELTDVAYYNVETKQRILKDLQESIELDCLDWSCMKKLLTSDFTDTQRFKLHTTSTMT